MGKHVNHYDAQDRLIIRNKIISSKANNGRSGSLADRDPGSLSITEQEQMAKERITAKIKNVIPTIITPKIRFTGRRP